MRNHRITGLAAVFGVALVAMPAHRLTAQMTPPPHIGVSAGMNIPLSTLSRTASMGYGLTGFFTTTPARSPVSFRGSVSYSSFASQPTPAQQNFTGFSLDAMLPAPGSPDAPYLVGGAGVEHASSYFGRPSENDFAYDLGMGYRWRRSGLGYFLEMRYVHVNHTGPAREMVPITFGVIF
jgi:hypothetical protein